MKNNYYSSNRLEMLKYVPSNCKTILEIGCGEGNFAKLCKEKTGANVIGIEYDLEAGLIASKKIDLIYIGDAFEEINKLENGSIDLVIFNDVLEHLAYPDKLLQSIRAKMAPNGLLLASIPNFRYISNLKHVIWDKDFKYDKEGGIRDYTHLKFFTKKSINHFFTDLHMQIINMDGISKNEQFILRVMTPLLKITGNYDVLFLQYAVLAKYI